MIWKIILGTFLLIVGVGMYLVSDYITDEVLSGKQQINKAQGQVDTIGDLSKLSPYTIGIGKVVTDSGQQKIDEGKKDVKKYEELARQLHDWGIITASLGALIVVLGFFTKRKKPA